MKYSLSKHQDSSQLTVIVPGDLLSTTVDPIRQKFSAILEESAVRLAAVQVVTLDLRAAKMMDSAGLNLLVSFVKLGRGLGFSLRLLVASNTLLRVLQFTRLDKLLEIDASAIGQPAVTA